MQVIWEDLGGNRIQMYEIFKKQKILKYFILKKSPGK